MFRHERLTLLVIPEAGGTTYEYKIRRTTILAALVGVLVVVVLLLLGGWYFFRAQAAIRRLTRVERERELLAVEVKRINGLEKVLLRLQRSNQQLRSILGESVRDGEEPERVPGHSRYESFVAPVDRLRWGHLGTFPGLWPVAGPVLQPFDERRGGLLIAAPEGALVRAAGAGVVSRAGYDDVLGFIVEVDHGEGLVSLYGHARQLLVEPGEYVAKGRPLAVSGRTGAVQTPCLYFAIRAHGRAIDPAVWRLWL